MIFALSALLKLTNSVATATAERLQLCNRFDYPKGTTSIDVATAAAYLLSRPLLRFHLNIKSLISATAEKHPTQTRSIDCYANLLSLFSPPKNIKLVYISKMIWTSDTPLPAHKNVIHTIRLSCPSFRKFCDATCWYRLRLELFKNKKISFCRGWWLIDRYLYTERSIGCQEETFFSEALLFDSGPDNCVRIGKFNYKLTVWKKLPKIYNYSVCK